mmetsp:Transcript_73416/g.134365  ORF Transcript_73416/g.134365 Transcript_73416/m.134365 type:complete len:105 (-) Transcript_73416:46-360(-)
MLGDYQGFLIGLLHMTFVGLSTGLKTASTRCVQMEVYRVPSWTHLLCLWGPLKFMLGVLKSSVSTLLRTIVLQQIQNVMDKASMKKILQCQLWNPKKMIPQDYT